MGIVFRIIDVSNQAMKANKKHLLGAKLFATPRATMRRHKNPMNRARSS